MVVRVSELEPRFATVREQLDAFLEYGKCALVFKSPLHAQLAFDTLAGPAEEDTSGRPQKKIYLDDGGGSGKRPYCKVRPF